MCSFVSMGKSCMSIEKPQRSASPEKPKKYKMSSEIAAATGHDVPDFYEAARWVQNKNRDSITLDHALAPVVSLLKSLDRKLEDYGEPDQAKAFHSKWEALKEKYPAIAQEGYQDSFYFPDDKSALDCMTVGVNLIDEYSNLGDLARDLFDDLK